MNNFITMIKIIWEITQFTILQLAKDKKSLAILLLMPFILIAILGTSLSGVMSGSEFKFEKAKLGIVDEDQTIASRLLVENGFNNNEIKQIIESEEFNRDEAEVKFKDREIDGILFIHDGYEYSFIYGHKDQLVLKMNPLKSVQTDIIKQILTQYHILGKMVVDSVNDGRALTNFPNINDFLDDQSIYLEVNTGGSEEKSINSFQYYAVGMGVMYALFTMFTGIGFILDEKKQNTLNRIKMMPFSSSLFYIGKSLAFFIITILQLLILFIGSNLAFGVDFGNYPLAIFGALLSYSLAISGLMILLIGWVKDQNSLNVFFSMGVPILAALGGSMIPVSSFPWFIEPISNLLPNRWAMEAIFDAMLNRPMEALNSMIILLSFALITSLIGIWQMRRREARTI